MVKQDLINRQTGFTDIVVAIQGRTVIVAFYLAARDPYLKTDAPFIFRRTASLCRPITPLRTAQAVQQLVTEIVYLMLEQADKGIPAAAEALTNESPKA